LEKQIASESKKGSSPKLTKLQESLASEKTNMNEQKDYVLHKMRGAINMNAEVAFKLYLYILLLILID